MPPSTAPEPAFDPAQRVVLACLVGDAAGAAAALGEDPDLEAFASFALRQEVVGEVAVLAEKANLPLPEPVRAGLAAHAARIAALLGEAGIPVVFAKGAVWDALLRPSDVPRTAKDLDLYLRRRDLPAALEAIAAGFDTIPCEPLEETTARLHHHGLRIPEAGLATEVHWDLAAPWHGLRFDLDGAIGRARQVRLGEGSVPCFAAGDEILFCALELAKDSWGSLKKIADFAAAVARGGDAALAEAERRARADGSARMLRIGLLLASELGILASAPAAARIADEDSVAARIAGLCRARLARGDTRPALPRRAREGLTLAGKHDRPAAQARHLWRIVILYRLRGWLGLPPG